METTDKDIIDHIKSIPSSIIYTFADKDTIKEAFSLYNRDIVKDIQRSAGGNLISVEVGSHFGRLVNMYVADNKLQFDCECRGAGESKMCSHTVCAFMTVKNVLQPEVFRIRRNGPDKRNRFLKILLQKEKSLSSPAPKYAFSIEREEDKTTVFFKVNGEKITSPLYYYRVPLKLKNFFKSAYSSTLWKDSFIAFLKEGNPVVPVFFKDSDSEVPVTLDTSMETETFTEIKMTKESVTVSKACHLKNNDSKELTIAGDFIVDKESGKFSVIRNKTGWNIWELIHRACDYSIYYNAYTPFYIGGKKSFTISTEVFNNSQVRFSMSTKKKALDSIKFTVEGTEYLVKNVMPLSYTMNIQERGEFFLLKPQGKAGDCEISASRIPYALLSSNLPHGINSAGKKRLIYKIFFETLTCETSKERDKIINKGLTAGIIKKRQNLQAAKSILRQYGGQPSKKLLHLCCHKGEWKVVQINQERESYLYSIPYELFGESVFKEMADYDEIYLDKKVLLPKLSELVARLKDHDISVKFSGKPVTTSVLSFSVKTTEGDIDWFEIRPEIRCDNKLLKNISIEDIVNNKGFFEDQGVIHAIDEQSYNALSAVGKMNVETNSNEEKIVRIPRLHILDWIGMRRLGVEVKLPPAIEKIIERLTHFDKIEDKTLPNGLKAKLRRYQKEGYHWLSFLYEHRFGACLADDMGLGKTIQAITLLAGLKEGLIKKHKRKKLPSMIIVPPTLLFNWESEIEKFYPNLKVYLYRGKERDSDFRKCDAVLTSYAIARNDIVKLEQIEFDVIIFDEAQAVKNIHADTTSAVRRLKACFKLAMTGTPVENHIGEYYSIMDISLPGLLGEYKEVKKEVNKEALEKVVQRTKPFILRRTKQKILKDLPPKTESNIYLDLTENQKALYNKTVKEVKGAIEEAYSTKTASQAKIIALTALLKLRQICLSPELLKSERKRKSPKLEFIRDRLVELIDEGHSALVFSQFTTFLDIAEREIKDSGLLYYRLDGSTPVGKRKKFVKEFQESENPAIFLLSLKAGGQGLNLTKASYIFHLDPWWNPAVENQASDRAHRIGQKNKVIITRLLMKHTIEEKIMELKRRKQNLYNAIMETPGKSGKAAITKEDLDYILSKV